MVGAIFLLQMDFLSMVVDQMVTHLQLIKVSGVMMSVVCLCTLLW